MNANTVFVLGAGFTRAFNPTAPLIVGDYGVQSGGSQLGLLDKFRAFPRVTAILEEALDDPNLEPDAKQKGYVNLERLMTRLNGMPYDGIEVRHELALLESSLRHSLAKRLEFSNDPTPDTLKRFGRTVLMQGASIVTFNYDDIVDKALYAESRQLAKGPSNTIPLWDPDGGYGFYCRSSWVCLSDFLASMDKCSSLVLKLHGSVNWRLRLGEQRHRGPTELLHHEGWTEKPQNCHHLGHDDIDAHLEIEPFIVPPVLLKTDLTLHPALQFVWKRAYEKLRTATRVVFIGYSLPLTDMASRTLFRESLSNPPRPAIDIVTLASTPESQNHVRVAYGLFDQATFHFDGAEDWIRAHCSESPGSTAS
jgi:SIR2-like domain